MATTNSLPLSGKPCTCGKKHQFNSQIITGKGVISEIPDVLKNYGATFPYIIFDVNTYKVAGENLCKILRDNGINYASFCYEGNSLEPDENAVEKALTNMPVDCDMVIGVGSGVINDISKIVSDKKHKKFIIVATAPSMDGYASSSSSVIFGGVKTTVSSHPADVIIGDIDVLKNAPIDMLISGVGDMLAKYVSICEWRIGALICDEYYCEEIAKLVRDSVKQVVESADSLLSRDETAVSKVFDALIIGSVAMNYAGISRPASGTEHYISHVLDMRGVEFKSPVKFHGVQCAFGTLVTVKLYEKLKNVMPNKEKALEYAKNFNLDEWNKKLKSLLGKSAINLIELEKKEKKYDCQKHQKRLDKIIDNWDKILKIIDEEIPSLNELESLMKKLGLPTSAKQLSIDNALLPEIFRATKDIRDKYVLSRLLWDLGIIDEFADSLYK